MLSAEYGVEDDNKMKKKKYGAEFGRFFFPFTTRHFVKDRDIHL